MASVLSVSNGSANGAVGVSACDVRGDCTDRASIDAAAKVCELCERLEDDASATWGCAYGDDAITGD